MRKHDVRKWIHAILDLLPLIVIPVFMVYSHRHTIDSYSVQAEETKVVEFNQLFRNDLDYNYTYQSGAEVTLDDYIVFSYVPNQSITYNFDLFDSQSYYIHFFPNHKYYLRLNVLEGTLTSNLFMYPGYMDFNEIHTISTDFYSALHFYADDLTNDFSLKFYFNVFDLTLMFGSGNEPTKQQFDTWYSGANYVFNGGTKQLLKTGNYVTYDDTDIGSQFFYSLYNTVDHYFNFGNVFNFNQIYDWLNLNVFNGNGPLSVYVVWNVFLYEFLMDLIFLLYALFMFFIDMCTNLIDRFTCQASGGRLK